MLNRFIKLIFHEFSDLILQSFLTFWYIMCSMFTLHLPAPGKGRPTLLGALIVFTVIWSHFSLNNLGKWIKQDLDSSHTSCQLVEEAKGTFRTCALGRYEWRASSPRAGVWSLLKLPLFWPEASVELESGGHPGQLCLAHSPVVNEVQGPGAAVEGSTQASGSTYRTNSHCHSCEPLAWGW